MKKVVFSVESKVIRDTLEYVFIGKDECSLELAEGISREIPFLTKNTALVVCECKAVLDEEVQLLCAKINTFRQQLDENIPLILFSENPEKYEGKIRDSHGITRIVTLDAFFLDSLFQVLQEELYTESIACYYQ